MSPSAEPMIGKDTFSLGEMVGATLLQQFSQRSTAVSGGDRTAGKETLLANSNDAGAIARHSRV